MRDLYILAGQSNMSGRGALAELPAFPNAWRVACWSNAETWMQAAEPVDGAIGQVDAVSSDSDAAAGPSLAFGDEMVRLRGRDVGLVPCAKGASSIADWRRDWRRTTLYGSCLARAREAMAYGTVRGLLFYQGESDTDDMQAVIDWPHDFAEIVAAFRADLGIPDLPVVFTRLGPEPNVQPYVNWGRLQLYQQQLADAGVPYLAMVDASDLAVQANDILHLTTASYVTLGRRYAAAMNALLGPVA